ncbi:antitoxin VapB family protein [Halococcoides cellulosivorans]|uniref:Uncharacterized protein n=1 Tax=Halococcoides cellulosivorans TaxID=1679096 RepID=A0A2R4X2F3_9EURY|nr:antitoxin VapB family protein [Halococcoides cellulosivorans]AWB27977.1 hypothetical protein HARCEL1_09790 [Halococcoides cellulosivorans]
MSLTVQHGEDTYAALTGLKADDETIDDCVDRLLDHRREAIDSGAGLWADSEVPEHARAARESIRSELDRPSQ